MKLATLSNGHPDGHLVVVSGDGKRFASASGISPHLHDALQRWDAVEAPLHALSAQLHSGSVPLTQATGDFDPHACMAPLPRTFQWLDGSAFLNHGRLMGQAFKVPAVPDFETVPLMYQGAADDFLGPHDDVYLPSEADQIDCEGEFGVVLSETPMGVTPQQALACVQLVVLLNDWSLRAFGPREVKSGFGFVQAKPSTAFAPIAITPDELGPQWRDGRVHLRLRVLRENQWVGHPHAGQMHFHFGQLIAHAARTRKLSAGTVVGSGTVSNADPTAGSTCLTEVRMREMLSEGAPRTPFLHFGERIRMEAVDDDGQPGPFGVLDQQVVRAPGVR
jgi:fumarylacetoacetate (FAA) hydrolase